MSRNPINRVVANLLKTNRVEIQLIGSWQTCLKRTQKKYMVLLIVPSLSIIDSYT